ncbi:tumor protein p63-regulated gene 1-like protein isoform X1 [Antedon mediterranea]|uniref:tumor protein p63-regulated gene 1-like protein isoform X1 n=1 Tax=Antedon mediterranea TaxID=105859 RepID=UPI003AF7FD91
MRRPRDGMGVIHFAPLQHTARDAKTYQVDAFQNAIVQAIKTATGDSNLNVQEAPLRFTIHIGLSSTVFNQSRIGFSRERGGVSF